MTKPRLFVIAGCNGSGKSSFANAITPEGIVSFDYDLEFLRIYNSMRDSELRVKIAHHQTRTLLEESINNAIQNGLDFCYETNFNSTPMFWPNKFKTAGFELNLFFFCLDSMGKAKKRVLIRVENGGHFVPDTQIEERFRLGYKHLNAYFSQFDFVHLMNSSFYQEVPHHILSIHKEEIIHVLEFPDFLNLFVPNIAKLIENKA